MTFYDNEDEYLGVIEILINLRINFTTHAPLRANQYHEGEGI